MKFKRFIQIHVLLITCLISHINIAQDSTDYDDSSDDIEIDIEIEIYDEEPHEVLAQQLFNSYIFPSQIIDKSYS